MWKFSFHTPENIVNMLRFSMRVFIWLQTNRTFKYSSNRKQDSGPYISSILRALNWVIYIQVSSCDYLHRSIISCGGQTQPVSMCACTTLPKVTNSTTINWLTRIHTTNLGLYVNQMFALWRTQEIWEGSQKTGFRYKWTHDGWY